MERLSSCNHNSQYIEASHYLRGNRKAAWQSSFFAFNEGDKTMHNSKRIAEAYIVLWNEGDHEARRQRLAEEWTADARYADPMMAGESRDGIADMITGARSQFPGHHFSLRGTPDGHGSFVRFSWSLAPADGSPVAGGTDVVRLDDQGRIAEVIGFLDGAGL
jgi:SnoaL-like domain